MSIIHLKKDNTVVDIDLKGAELLRFSVDGVDVIWQRDPNIWNGSAPILFPIVGKLLNDRYVVDDKTYSMNKHGILRDKVFSIQESGKSSCVLSTRSNSDTLKVYPYEFEFRVMFELEESNRLVVSYEIDNLNRTEMYFSFGSHPAMNLDMENTALDDYYIEFDKDESLDRFSLVNGLLTSKAELLELDNSRLYLSETIFNQDALIFTSLKSSLLTLGNDKTGYKVKFNTGGVPNLGIWAKPGAPYVCLEPWYGYDDTKLSDGQFKNKPGILSLEAGKTFKTNYSIEI